MSTGSGPQADLELAHLLADAAGVVSLGHFQRELRRWRKADGSLATEADLAVEDEVRGRLGVERPGDAVLGEERGQTGSGYRRWIIDGIDGTADFVAGSPHCEIPDAAQMLDIVFKRGLPVRPELRSLPWSASRI